MTVAELMAALEHLSPDLTVMADDREDGRYRVTNVQLDDYYGTLPSHVVIR